MLHDHIDDGITREVSLDVRNSTSRRGKAVLTIDLFEHLEHALDIVVVEEPRLGVLVVLLERNPERVGDVDRLARVLTEQHAHDAF